ncbi:hypothetical protein D3C84_1201340 [compost metagenome]
MIFDQMNQPIWTAIHINVAASTQLLSEYPASVMPDTTTGGALFATPAAAAAVARSSSFPMHRPSRNDKARTRRARNEKGQGR